MSQPEPDHRARLKSLLERLQSLLDDPETTPRDVASLSREYRQTLTALSVLGPAAGQRSKLDEIAARRRKRGA